VSPEIERLLEAATRPYRGAGRYAWHFARGKLRYDPVFVSLLRRGVLPNRGKLLDLGCGQGVLLSLLEAAKAQYPSGAWPREWPAPPMGLTLQGVELREDRLRAARQALDAGVEIVQGDVRKIELQRCAAIAILDVMLYLDESEQERLLDGVAAALDPGGLLLLREADASAGFAFQVTKWSERIAGAMRGDLVRPLRYRSAMQWIAELAQRGFTVSAEPMSAGTPFANVLFIARKERVTGFPPSGE
jgi:SAM-dependent methyltransferase